ncbi:MAG: hypothetical protein WBP85_11185 [Terracidiphilus sp.]
MSELKRAIHSLDPEGPRAERWPVAGLTALYGLDFPDTPAPIKNISSTGIFLNIIEEALPVGELFTLAIEIDGASELSSEPLLTLQARAVRQDEFGAGFAFVPPPSLDPALWEVFVRGLAFLTDPVQVAQVFRTLRTVLFLCRLCPSGAEEAVLLLDGHLDKDRAAALFKFASAVENRLLADPDADRFRAHPKLVANLLREGIWAPDELTTELWKGLFISSCLVDKPDDSNQIFVDLLIHITAHQARILTHACERVRNSARASGGFASGSVVLSPDEMVRLNGVSDLGRNATDLAHLFNLGLIKKLFDFTSYREIDCFDITPSPLGLELCRHCQGERGKIDPQLAAFAREQLAVMNPPLMPSTFENFTFLQPSLTH